MSNIYSAVFSPYQQSTLGVSSDCRWVIHPPPAKSPLFYLGARPFDLNPADKVSGHGASPHSSISPALRQTYLNIGQDVRWYLTPQMPQKHDLRSHLLSLPVELRLRIFSHLLVTGNDGQTKKNGNPIMSSIMQRFLDRTGFVGRKVDRAEELDKTDPIPAQITVDAYGQLKLASLRERWPDVYKFSCLLNVTSFQNEAMEIFWGMNEVVIDVRGLPSFYENWSIYVRKLKVVVGTWDPKKCGQKERSDLEQQMMILTQNKWPKLEEIQVVVCFWGGFWGLFGENIATSLEDSPPSSTQEAYQKDIPAEIETKWDALAPALIDLRERNILKGVVKRSYTESPKKRHSFLPSLCFLDNSDTHLWHKELMHRSHILDRWETSWDMATSMIDTDGTDLRAWTRYFLFAGLGRYHADAKFAEDRGRDYRKSYDYFSQHVLEWVDQALLAQVQEIQNEAKWSYPFWWRFSHWKLHAAIRGIIWAREPRDEGHKVSYTPVSEGD